MPGLSGIDFLKLVRVRHPSVVRIMLTGDPNPETTLRSINESEVYRFIRKPWNNRDLRTIVYFALEVSKLQLENQQLIDLGRKQRDIRKMLDYARQHKSIDGFPGGEPIENTKLFGLDVDILVPAALENQITMENAPVIKAKIVAEGANGPTTPDAHQHLHERGVFVIPDILANAGGVTTSYFEWVKDRHGYFWEESEVNKRLEHKMCEAFDDVLGTSLRYKTDMRTAAYIVAINRVATVTKMRGMYA